MENIIRQFQQPAESTKKALSLCCKCARLPFPGFVILYGPVYLPLRVFSLVPLINFFHTLSRSLIGRRKWSEPSRAYALSLALAQPVKMLCVHNNNSRTQHSQCETAPDAIVLAGALQIFRRRSLPPPITHNTRRARI